MNAAPPSSSRVTASGSRAAHAGQVQVDTQMRPQRLWLTSNAAPLLPVPPHPSTPPPTPQSWATYGFTLAHRYTQDPAHAAAAAAAADCFIRLTSACCGDNYAPWWDFYAGPPLAPQTAMTQRDTSAAVIATAGIIELAWNSEPDARARLLAYAQSTLEGLVATYITTPAQSNGVLNNGTTTYVNGAGWGIPITYGDYYLLVASMRWDATPAEWRREAAAYLAANGRKF